MTTFRLRDDKDNNPVVHAQSCFCPSMATTGFKEVDSWLAEADDLGSLAEELEEDAIASGALSRAEARRMIRIGHCLDAPEGVGRRYGGRPTDMLGEWEREVERKKKGEQGIHTKQGKLANAGSRPKPILPSIKTAKMAFQETDRKPGAPATSHANCDHPVTKSARAACRRKRAKNA